MSVHPLSLLNALVPTILLILVIGACSPDSSEKSQADEIDYSSIPEVELDLMFRIGDSEDYLPGNIQHITINNNGDVLIDEISPRNIYQFDSVGNFMDHVARPGRGPGELSRYAQPHYMNDLLYLSNNGAISTEFRLNEAGYYEHVTDYNLNPPSGIRNLYSSNDLTKFYSLEDSIDYPFLEIPPEFTTKYATLIKKMSNNTWKTDTLFSLTYHRPFQKITDGGRSMTYRATPYRFVDRFAVINDTLRMISSPLEESIRLYNADHELVHKLDLNLKKRPLTENDMEFHFEDTDPSELNEIEAIMMDYKPAFTAVFMDDHRNFWLKTDETAAGSEYVILSYEGKPVGRIVLPGYSDIKTIADGKVVVVSSETQTTIEVYRNPFEQSLSSLH